MKSFITGIIFTGCASVSFAHPVNTPADTTRKDQTMVLPVQSLPTVTIREANIAFPPILAGQELLSIDYIEQFCERRRDYLIRTYQRSKAFFPKVANIFKKYQVPEEFKVLMALESGFNGHAISSAGAVGYWQFMDAVAREYGLKIAAKEKPVKSSGKNKKGSGKNIAKQKPAAPKAKPEDDRTNFIKSTHAAARYIKDRGRNLNNDWLLMAASYNCGVGNVWNAMERSGKPEPSFWDIRHMLPAETQAYVMNFITLNVIFHNYDSFIKSKLIFKDEVCIDDAACTNEPDIDSSVSMVK